jgi:hypothetical protein
MASERRKTIKFIRLGQTVSNRAKAIISEKAGHSIHFLCRGDLLRMTALAPSKINPSVNSFGVKNGI